MCSALSTRCARRPWSKIVVLVIAGYLPAMPAARAQFTPPAQAGANDGTAPGPPSQGIPTFGSTPIRTFGSTAAAATSAPASSRPPNTAPTLADTPKAPPGPRFAGSYFASDGYQHAEYWYFFKNGTWAHTTNFIYGATYSQHDERGMYALRGNTLELIPNKSESMAGSSGYENMATAGKNRPVPPRSVRFKNLGSRGIELDGKLYSVSHSKYNNGW